MMQVLKLTLLATALVTSHAWIMPSAGRRASHHHMAIKVEQLEDIGYSTKVSKPLGVVFGENPHPFYGLRVDEADDGSNGKTAGLKVGDQLLVVNGKSCVGKDFDRAMYMLREAEDPMEMQLYRGPVRQLYTILSNRGALSSSDDDEELEEEEEVVMDENYESPVQIPLEEFEDKPLKAGDVLNAFKNIGGKKDGDKKGGGLFGGMFSKETVQLDGDEAKGIK